MTAFTVISSHTGNYVKWEDGELTGDPLVIGEARALDGAPATVSGPWVEPDWDDPAASLIILAKAMTSVWGPEITVVDPPAMPDYGPSCCEPPDPGPTFQELSHADDQSG